MAHLINAPQSRISWTSLLVITISDFSALQYCYRIGPISSVRSRGEALQNYRGIFPSDILCRYATLLFLSLAKCHEDIGFARSGVNGNPSTDIPKPEAPWPCIGMSECRVIRGHNLALQSRASAPDSRMLRCRHLATCSHRSQNGDNFIVASLRKAGCQNAVPLP